jgi:hypothetical protein
MGQKDSIHVGAEIHYRQFPNNDDKDDGNWVRGVVNVNSGSIRGSFECWLCTYDFPAFREAVEQLYESLEGEAKFSTMEDGLFIRLHGDGIGHIDAEVTAVDRSLGTFATLSFTMQIDQTYLPEVVAQLRDIESEFPVVGYS